MARGTVQPKGGQVGINNTLIINILPEVFINTLEIDLGRKIRIVNFSLEDNGGKQKATTIITPS